MVGDSLTEYLLGSAAILNAPGSYDVGSNFFPGNGIGLPATFTAQATGMYQIEFGFTLSALSSTLPGILVNGIYKYTVYDPQTASMQRLYALSLTIGDVVTIGVTASRIPTPGLNVGVLANAGAPLSSALTRINLTYISGYRIA